MNNGQPYAPSDTSTFNDRIFRELTGFSAVEYQRKRRLRRAAHLLRHEPDVAVVPIAQDCGFPSNPAFAKDFKQRFTMSAKASRDGGWRTCMDQQVRRESDVSFFVAEPDNLDAILAPYITPEPGSMPSASRYAHRKQQCRPKAKRDEMGVSQLHMLIMIARRRHSLQRLLAHRVADG